MFNLRVNYLDYNMPNMMLHHLVSKFSTLSIIEIFI